MPAETSLPQFIRNLLTFGHLSFRDFMELALYHPEFGYYATDRNRVGKGGDYVTAPTLSPVFSFAISGLFREFVRRGEGAVCSFVDVGCGDGSLVRAVAEQVNEPGVRFFGVDRALGRVTPSSDSRVTFVGTIEEVARDGAHLIFSSELFDAFPFSRVVQRGEHLHELWIGEREDGSLDWTEHEAPHELEDYFASRDIHLLDGQFADVTPEWSAYYEDVARFVERGLIVTLDYGFAQQKLFHPRARRFGTAAAYSGHRVHRDLLADPGEQDLTAHINFTDLMHAGERHGAQTLFFDNMARFLLAVGATEHELFKPIEELAPESVEDALRIADARDEARRLILPDGMGEDLRVLVQAKNVIFENWSFQRKLF